MTEKTELKILQKNNLENKICLVLGTRPGIVMFSPIIKALEDSDLEFFMIHTGQHYSNNMDQTFFEDLELPEPEYKLGEVKNCNYHGEQTAEMLRGCEKVLLEEKPKIAVVGGDANTNLAGALAAKKLQIKVAHVEAGERSGDLTMPEEQNRVMIDHISDFLFATNGKARKNLQKEKVQGQIIVTGNPIVDALHRNIKIAERKSTILREYKLKPEKYFLMTLHRENNVDSKQNLSSIIEGIKNLCNELDTPVVFLAHPRTEKRLEEFNLKSEVEEIEKLKIKEAVGYLDFIYLLSNSKLVLTDSGGVQQESYILNKPCVTLRETTEWTETVKTNANTLAGADSEEILESVKEMLERKNNTEENIFGDGESAKNIVRILENSIRGRSL